MEVLSESVCPRVCAVPYEDVALHACFVVIFVL